MTPLQFRLETTSSNKLSQCPNFEHRRWPVLGLARNKTYIFFKPGFYLSFYCQCFLARQRAKDLKLVPSVIEMFLDSHFRFICDAYLLLSWSFQQI